MAKLHLRTLGGIAVEDSGRLLGPAAGQPKRLALLALIAGAGPQGVSRDRLLACLWPESDEARARNALNQAIHTLRRDLLTDVLVEGTSSLRLNPSSITPDFVEFRAAISNRELERAVELYRGPFLDGFFVRDAPEFERWVEEQRRELQRLAVESAAELADQSLANHDHRNAIKWNRRVLAISPQDESALRKLLELLRQTGDRAGGAELYQQFERRLATDLGVAPSPETQKLYLRLKADALIPEESAARPSGGTPENYERDSPPSPAERFSAPPRRRSSLLIATLLVLTIGVPLLLRRASGILPSRVLVIEMTQPLEDTLASRARGAAREWILGGLTEAGRLDPVLEIADIAGERGSEGVARRGQRARAEAVLQLFTSLEGDSLRLKAQIIDSRKGTILGTASRSALRGSDLTVALEGIRGDVLTLLVPALAPSETKSSERFSRAHSWNAYQSFVAGRDLFVRTGLDDAFKYLNDAVTADNTFTLPSIWLLYGYIGMGNREAADSVVHALEPRYASLPLMESALLELAKFRLAGSPSDAYSASKRISSATPASEWNYWAADAALDAGFPRQAVELLKGIAPSASWRRISGGFPYWNKRLEARLSARDYQGLLGDIPSAESEATEFKRKTPLFKTIALICTGRGEEALAVLASVAQGKTESMYSANDLTRLVVSYFHATGHSELALRALALAEESVARGDQETRGLDPNSLDWRAPVAYWKRDWQAARALYDSVATERLAAYEKRGAWQILLLLQGRRGILAARMGDSAAAGTIDRWLERTADSLKLKPQQLHRFLMARARIAASLGNRGRALFLLEQAINIGWVSVWHELEFQALRGDPVFERLTRPKG